MKIDSPRYCLKLRSPWFSARLVLAGLALSMCYTALLRADDPAPNTIDPFKHFVNGNKDADEFVVGDKLSTFALATAENTFGADGVFELKVEIQGQTLVRSVKMTATVPDGETAEMDGLGVVKYTVPGNHDDSYVASATLSFRFNGQIEWIGVATEFWVFYAEEEEEIDTDGDFLYDDEEVLFGSDPNDPDSDDDGLYDYEEWMYGTNPNDGDSDGGGVGDYEEVYIDYTDPTNASDDGSNDDADSDGLTDEDEDYFGTDPNDADSDDDGLGDYEEIMYGTNPLATDTDGGGTDDYVEIYYDYTDPLDGFDDVTP